MTIFTSTTLAWLQGPEVMVIFLVLLLLFGAKKLPQLARGIGKSAGEFKRARAEFENEITQSENETIAKKDKEEKSKDA